MPDETKFRHPRESACSRLGVAFGGDRVIQNKQTCRYRLMAGAVCLFFIAQSTFAQQAEVGLRLQIVQGEGNRNTLGQTTAAPIAVRVTDRNNRPIAGASVVFTAPDKGASGDFDGELSFRTLTDDNGAATVKNFRPNQVEGRYPILVQAEYLGELATAIMVQNNVAAKKSHGKVIAIVAAAGAVGAALAARGGGGGSSNPSTPSANVPTITFGGATVTGPR